MASHHAFSRSGRTVWWTAWLLGMLLSACGAETHVKKGDAFYAIGEYFDAAAEYKKAYSRTPVKEKPKRGQRAW